ncbi:MAG: hypothetical protein ABIK89_26110, partial [Planctomycetota bacterium]
MLRTNQPRPLFPGSNSTNARTAGVISASSAGGIASGFALADDMVHVVLENALHVQINFAKEATQGASDYVQLCRLAESRWTTTADPNLFLQLNKISRRHSKLYSQ